MRLKSEVRFGDPQLALSFASQVVEGILLKAGYEYVITSVNDGRHMIGSKHGTDEAFDFRSHHIHTLEEKTEILNQIKSSLTIDFDILLEHPDQVNEHYHLEYDKK